MGSFAALANARGDDAAAVATLQIEHHRSGDYRAPVAHSRIERFSGWRPGDIRYRPAGKQSYYESAAQRGRVTDPK
jgi:hypothetical protein